MMRDYEFDEENERPEHQQKRGERFGNLRRQKADLKVRQRRNDRARRNAEKREMITERY